MQAALQVPASKLAECEQKCSTGLLLLLSSEPLPAVPARTFGARLSFEQPCHKSSLQEELAVTHIERSFWQVTKASSEAKAAHCIALSSEAWLRLKRCWSDAIWSDL